jgi:ribulose-phosphate 3-epimerase
MDPTGAMGADVSSRGRVPASVRPSLIVAPSLLAADSSRLSTELKRFNRARAQWLHLDIMDGHFVPNLSFGPDLVRRLRPLTRAFFDVHLMCARPEILLEPFTRSGANGLTVHVELGDRVPHLLWQIRALGRKVGLAINPPTSMSHAQPFLPHVDQLLIMTVNPGFGGQTFITETLPKIQQARAWREQKGWRYRILVDGGIGFDTAPECARAGADTFVSGSALFGKPNLKAAVQRMTRLVRQAGGALTSSPRRRY